MTRRFGGRTDHSRWEIITWIIGLCISVTVAAIALIDVRPTQTYTGNSTVVVYNPVLREPFISLADILPSIAAILGTFFAIACAFSQFVIPNIAEKYSPRMVSHFRRDRRYRYAYSALFLSVVTTSSLLLMTRFPDPYVQTVTGVIVIGAFTLVLIIFLVYYSYIYQIVDPLSFYVWVANQIKASINDVESVDQGSKALGDCAVKGIIRGGEDEYVEKCVDSLKDVAHVLVGEGDQQTADCFDGVLDQLRRIHDAAQKHGDTSITRYLYLAIREIGVKLFERA